MPYSEDNIVATGSRIEVAAIAFGSKAPARFVVTVGTAGAENDTTLELSADVEMEIRDGHRIDFADGSYAIVALPITSTADIFTITTTPVAVPVQPLAGAVTTATTAVTKYRDMGFENKAVDNLPYIFPYRLILGPTNISTVPTSETVDATDLNSGFGVNTTIVGNRVETSIDLNRKYRDRGFREVIDPIVHDLQGNDIQRLVWKRVTEADGTVYEGPTRCVLSGKSNSSRQLMTSSLTLTFEGSSYSYIPSELALYGLS